VKYCLRLFQIVPSLVLFATISMTLASFPLFIFDPFLKKTLPPLIIYGTVNREMAIERESNSFSGLNHEKTDEDEVQKRIRAMLIQEYSWRLTLRGIILFWNESRLLQFIQSSLTLFFSFLLLIYTPELLVYLMAILVVLLLFIITKSLVLLLYLGSSLDLKDVDFPEWLRPRKKYNLPTSTIGIVSLTRLQKGRLKKEKYNTLSSDMIQPSEDVIVINREEDNNVSPFEGKENNDIEGFHLATSPNQEERGDSSNLSSSLKKSFEDEMQSCKSGKFNHEEDNNMSLSMTLKDANQPLLRTNRKEEIL
jgi:hypothetical protein